LLLAGTLCDPTCSLDSFRRDLKTSRLLVGLLVYLYLWVDGPASWLASVVHIVLVVAVVGILEGVDSLRIHHCRRETIPIVDRTCTKEDLPYVES